MENKKMMEEPKEELVELELVDNVVASGSQFASCSGNSNDDDCTYPAMYNY